MLHPISKGHNPISRPTTGQLIPATFPPPPNPQTIANNSIALIETAPRNANVPPFQKRHTTANKYFTSSGILIATGEFSSGLDRKINNPGPRISISFNSR